MHRAYNICNNWLNFHEELEKLRDHFCKNGYPNGLINKHIKRFISRKIQVSNNKVAEIKETRCITLPFQGHFSYQLRNTMSSLLRKHIPDINFRFVLINKCSTIGSLFRYKDHIPTLLCSNIVYMFKCPDCMSLYVGSTSRNLKIRIAEHKSAPYRSGTRITSPSFSKIREHALECNHQINEEDFSIMYKAKCASDLRIAESLYIIKDKPELNDTEFATKLLIFS